MSHRGVGKAEPTSRALSQEEAAVFETFIVPSYLTLFGEPLLERLVPTRDARVCHLECRTGYPDRALLIRLPNAHIHGVDASEHAIALARAKASTVAREAGADVVFDYRVVGAYPLPYPAAAFSHTLVVHPSPVARATLFAELARITAPRGQALLALPLRGSFAELTDLLRECALKHDLTDLEAAVETLVQLRPTDDLLGHELATAGFGKVITEVHSRTLTFTSGRAFLEDPVVRLLLAPEVAALLPTRPAIEPFAYVRDAIDKYWSEGGFALSVNVGVTSARRR